MNKYHVFSALDYKGGELRCSINLTLERAIESVYGYWLDDVDDFLEITDGERRELDDDEIDSLLGSHYVSRYDTYAGYNGSTHPEVYISTENGLKSYNFEHEDLIKWARKFLDNDEDYKKFLANER